MTTTLDDDKIVIKKKKSFISQSRRKEIKHTFFLFKKSPMFILGVVMVGSIFFLALAAPLLHSIGIVPFEAQDRSLNQNLMPPLTIDNRTYGYWISENLDTDTVARGNIRIATGSIFSGKLKDMVIGDESGNLYSIKNEGNETTPVFLSSKPLLINNQPSSTMEVDGYAQPSLADLNGDILLDLVIGTENGSVFFSQNIGSPLFPVWSDLQPLTKIVGNVSSPIVVDSKASPCIYDLDRDGDYEVVLGTGNGSMHFYENKGNATHWEYQLVDSPDLNFVYSKDMKETGFTTAISPTFGKFSPEQKNEQLLVVTDTGDMFFFSATRRTISLKEYYEIVSTTNQVLPTLEDIGVPQSIALVKLNGDDYNDILYFTEDGTLIQALQLFDVDGRMHLFGLDFYGGDVFSRCIWALQLDIVMSIWIVLTAIIIGVILGSFSGYFGGVVDTVIMRITDVFYAFPSIILAMAIASVLGRNMFNLGLALIFVWWTGYTRLIRAQVLLEKEKAYVEAARAQGFSNIRILFSHILPNSWYPVLVNATLDLGSVILSLAGLSFIGFGAPIGEAELGRMIADGKNFFLNSPWLTFFPGLFIFIIVMGWNLVGDGLRDVLDPKLRR